MNSIISNDKNNESPKNSLQQCNNALKKRVVHHAHENGVSSNSDMAGGVVVATKDATQTQFYCSICDKYYASYKSFGNHTRSYHSKNKEKARCEHCGNSFTRKDNLQQHIKLFHSAVQATFPCTFCGKVFNSRNTCSKHKKNCSEQRRVLDLSLKKTLELDALYALNNNNNNNNNNNDPISNNTNNDNHKTALIRKKEHALPYILPKNLHHQPIRQEHSLPYILPKNSQHQPILPSLHRGNDDDDKRHVSKSQRRSREAETFQNDPSETVSHKKNNAKNYSRETINYDEKKNANTNLTSQSKPHHCDEGAWNDDRLFSPDSKEILNKALDCNVCNITFLSLTDYLSHKPYCHNDLS